MRRNAIIVILLAFTLSGQAWAQPIPPILWQKCLGGTTDDVANSIVQTSDGGFALAGYTTSQDNGNVLGNHGGEDGWVVKIDANGAFQWQVCLGGAGTDLLNSIIQTSDGGYAVAGHTYSSSLPGYHSGGDAYVVKLDNMGGIQWQNCVGGSLDDAAYSIIQTPDSGFVIAGQTYSNDGNMSTTTYGAADAFIAKLNKAGTFQWEKNYGGSSDDGAVSIKQTADGGFALAGWTESTDGEVTGYLGGATDEWIVKLDDVGDIVWEECLGGNQEDQAYSIIQTTDGGLAIAGYTTSNDDNVSGNHGNQDMWVTKLNDDFDGSIAWQKCLGGTGNDEANSIVQTSDGGYAVAGFTNSVGGEVLGDHGGGDEWVVRLDDTGAILWQRCLGGSQEDYASSIVQTSDGNYAVAGYAASDDGNVTNNHGGEDAWVVLLGNPDPPVISYITPDAGAPGMCVAVEIVGPAGNQQNFGDDQLYSTNALVSFTRPSDSLLVRLGPSIVSWNGREIQQMFMIEPHAGTIDTEIYFAVTWNGATSAVDSFRIVTPTHFIPPAGGGTLPTTGRTKRNTMVVDSMILTSGTYTLPTTDPDPNTPGNQAYLPLRILSMGPIRLTSATLSANGAPGVTGTSGGSGGSGGGGGGSGYPGAGGAGYTGGGGDNDGSNGPGGAGSGSATGSSAWTGGSALSGITGGNGEQHSGSGGDDGGGGGTGHPFGSSGTNGGGSTSPAGAYGAGSAGGSSGPPFYTSNYGGGGGGNEASGTAGQGSGDNSGHVVGNPMLVPLAGGSGGGAGNQTYSSFLGNSKGGSGGGGGGAIELTSFAGFNGQSSHLTAQGGSGSNAVPIETAAGGGGGAGGAISVSARDSVVIDAASTFSVTGGAGGTSSSSNSNGGAGGLGRVRINGFVSKTASPSSANYYSAGNGYTGPSIQSVTYSTDSFVVKGYAEYWDGIPTPQIAIEVFYFWPSLGIWQSVNANLVTDPASHTAEWTWGDTLLTNTIDTELYVVAVQNESAVSGTYTDVPPGLMSHTSGIIAKVVGPPKMLVKVDTMDFGDVLVDTCSRDTTIEIYSIGQSTLLVNSVKLSPAIPDYKIIMPNFPQSIAPGDSLGVVLSFCPTSNNCPIATTLNINSNGGDTNVALTGCGVQPQMIIHPDTLDFGRVHIGDCKDSFVVVSNPGKDTLTISDELLQTSFPFTDGYFTSLDHLPIFVPPDSSIKLNWRWCPADTDLRTAYDTIIGDAPQSPVTLTLIGSGKIGILSMPTLIDFGLVHLDSCKDSVFYAKNTGNDTLVITSGLVAVSGFSPVSPILPIVLQPNDSLAIDIRFCSTDTGSFSAVMTLATDVPSQDSVRLLAHSGIGILQMLNVVDFGSVATGGCKDTTIQLKNIGTDTLVLDTNAVFTPPFSYVGPLPIVLAPGAIDTVKLRFCPQDTNEATETTAFDTIGFGIDTTFMLRGKGIEGALSTSGAIDIGCMALGSVDTERITIGNAGTVTLQNIAAALTPVGSGAIVHPPPTTLAPGAKDSVKLIVPAQTLGSFSATLTLTCSNGAPVTVPITAQVSVPPAITSLDPIVQFDSTAVGDSSIDTECIRITNYSCIPIPLDSIFVSGGRSGEFEIVSKTTGPTIADSAIATICLHYKAQQPGNASSTVVATSGGDTISLATLSGYGIGKAVGVELAIDTVAGRPGDIVNVPVRALNDVTAASIDSVTFRVTFNPMQLDLKAPIAPTTSGIESSNAPTYSTITHSIGDKEITATFPTPLTGTPIIAELPFEILEPTANTADVHLQSASFGASLATLSSTSDGLIQIEQCDTLDRVELVPQPIDVAPNNPNPFGTRTAVTVTVHTAGHLKLELYNALGSKVLVPFNADVQTGTQTIELDASALGTGAYRYITTWTWNGSEAPAYQPMLQRDEKTMIVLGGK